MGNKRKAGRSVIEEPQRTSDPGPYLAGIIAEDSRELYRTLAEAARDMIYIIGRDGTVLYVNSFAARAFGKSPDEIIGKNRNELFPKDVADVQEKKLGYVFEKGEPLFTDDVTVFFDHEIWQNTHLVPIKDEKGNVSAIIGVSRDITERKHMEQELREVEERLNQMAESINEVFFIGSSDWKNAYFISPAYEKIFGLPLKNAYEDPLSWFRVVHPEDIDRIVSAITKEAKGDFSDTGPTEFRIVRPDGALRWLSSRSYPVKNKNGEIYRVAGIVEDITGRKQSEKFLRQSQFFIEKAADMAIWIAPDSTIVYVNEAACKTFGYDREEFLRRKTLDTNPAFDETSWGEHWKELKKRGSFTFEAPLRKKDGSMFPAEITANYLVYEGEEYNCSYVRDITDRKRSEEALRDSELRFRQLADRSPMPMAMYDSGENVTYLNDKFTKTFGYTLKEIPQLKSWWPLAFPAEGYRQDVMGRWNKNVEKAKAERKEIEPLEVMITCKDGSTRCIVATGANIGDKELVIFNDITERKHDEAELVRVNRALQAISKCNEAMIHAREEYALLEDICQIIVEVGGYRMAWIGYAENNGIKTVRAVTSRGYENGYVAKAAVTWADNISGRGPMGTAIRTGKPVIVRNTMTDPYFGPWRDEAIKRGYASVLGLPLISNDHAFGGLTIYSDKIDAFDKDEMALLQDLADNLAYGITSLRGRIKKEQAEKELKDAKAQAEMYLDLMGHDINNMNQIALGFLELALGTMDENDPVREMISRPLEALESSTNLITNVRRLQQSRESDLMLQPMDVGQTLREVIPRFSNVVGRVIAIEQDLECDCYVMANGLLHDVFSNIIGNAIKHSSGPLVIAVSLKKAVADGKQYCVVSIEDNGPGIPDNVKDDILNRFREGSTKSSGRGLGLYLVKTLVEDFHGKTYLENRIHGDYTKGTRFVVTLPVVQKVH